MLLPSRGSALASLTAHPSVDVLIVGSGINGAGVLRELALNRIDALLVDQSDFAAGGAHGLVFGRNIYQHPTPDRIVAATTALIHRGASGNQS